MSTNENNFEDRSFPKISPEELERLRKFSPSGEGTQLERLKGKTYTAYELRAKQKKIELMNYLIQDYSVKEAAQACGIAYATARIYLRDPEILAQLRNLSMSVYERTYTEVLERKLNIRQRVLDAAEDALSVMEELLVTGSDNMRFKVAQDLMDRHGEVPRASRTESKQTVMVVDAEMLQIAAQTAKELAGIKVQPRLIKADEPEG